MPFATANGQKIFFKEEGAGEPLLLLMGLGADGETWRAHADAYNKAYRCILVDNRGAGRSDQPAGPYTTEQMARDALAVLDVLGVARAHAAGISMGGAIAQELALLAPERVRSLVLVSTWARLEPYGTAVFRMLRDSYAALDARTFARLLQLWIFSPAHFAQQSEDLLAREEGAAQNPAPMPPHAFAAQCDACMGHNTLPRLGKIACPALITVGTEDSFTPLHYSEALKAGIAGSRIERFAPWAHTHHWEDLQRFNALTLDFLRQQP